MTVYAVQVTNLRRQFGNFVAVNDISFEVEKGEIFGFLGPNGAGKSTTIRMLCGLLLPSGGQGTVAGYDLIKESEKIKTRIGYMSQKFSLYQTLTVEENLDFYAGIYLMNRDTHARKKDEFFSQTDLGKVRNRLVADLPVGARQLLALFCAIQHDPEMIFLDEPTAGVDPLARRYFWEQINHLSERNVTIFVTTHYLDEAEECDRIAMIFNGKLAAIGGPDVLKKTRFPGRVYSVLTEHPWETADQLRTATGVADVTLFGSELHATLRPEVEVGAVIESLPGHLLGTVTATELIPTLEDLFIALTREELK
jgi:ABC-2 type transport system ATP-binding protein